MTELTQAEIEMAEERVSASIEVSSKIIKFLEEEGISMPMAVLAMGIAFAGGARISGMSLPHAIELVRSTYKMGQSHETH